MAEETIEKEVKPVEAVETPTPKPTEADMEYQRDKMKHVFFGYPDPEKKLEAEPEKEKADGDTTTVVVEKEKEPEKKEEKKPKSDAERLAVQQKAAALAREAKARKRAERPQQTDEERTEVIAAATAAGVEKALAKVAPRIEEDLALSEDELDKLQVMGEMAAKNASYKDLADKTKTFWKKEAQYAKTWQEKNPGEVFDPDDEAHSRFYQEHEPTYSEREFRKAEVRLEARPLAEAMVQERSGANERRLLETETKQRMRDEADELEGVSYNTQKDMVRGLVGIFNGSEDESLKLAGTELAEALGVGDEFELTEASVAKLKDNDPVAHKILTEEADKLRLCVLEVERVTRYPAAHKFDPDKAAKLVTTGAQFYPHREIDAFAKRLEADMAEMTPEEIGSINPRYEGKTFLTQPQWNAKLQQIHEAKVTEAQKRGQWDALNERYFQLDSAMIVRGLAGEFAGHAAKRIAEINELTNARLKKKAPAGSQHSAPVTTEKPGIVKERPKPPASQGASAPADKASQTPVNDEERLATVSRFAF